jgi:hypothetical protein
MKLTSRQSGGEPRCPYCGSTQGLIWVHGHGQCAHCGVNTQECCQGEVCDTDMEPESDRN